MLYKICANILKNDPTPYLCSEWSQVVYLSSTPSTFSFLLAPFLCRLAGMFVPVALLLLLGVLATALAAIVTYKYLHDRNARGGWRIGAMGRYTKVVEMPDRNTVRGRWWMMIDHQLFFTAPCHCSLISASLLPPSRYSPSTHNRWNEKHKQLLLP